MSLRSGIEALLQDEDMPSGQLRAALRVLLADTDMSPADSAKLTGLWLDAMIAHHDAQLHMDAQTTDDAKASASVWVDLYKARAELLERLGAMPNKWMIP